MLNLYSGHTCIISIRRYIYIVRLTREYKPPFIADYYATLYISRLLLPIIMPLCCQKHVWYCFSYTYSCTTKSTLFHSNPDLCQVLLTYLSCYTHSIVLSSLAEAPNTNFVFYRCVTLTLLRWFVVLIALCWCMQSS